MKTFEIENPMFFGNIEETITRDLKPFELQLAEIRRDELIYSEEVQNLYLDKRNLG